MTGLACIYATRSTLPWYGFLTSIAVAGIFILFFGAQTRPFTTRHAGRENAYPEGGTAFVHSGCNAHDDGDSNNGPALHSTRP
ncbi:hypothetical protein B0J12DRAFT_213452 [Macrophomina phaseolina]|uniref:Uncharacterized protein n=1 Tax=Macrophomina phaseolina TaxID=35725 RepID=A0ABQ8G1E4_9PEZI|nr:hypothetical protein B0J12DRAFT_213452 [Macrophomina phaseolina]